MYKVIYFKQNVNDVKWYTIPIFNKKELFVYLNLVKSHKFVYIVHTCKSYQELDNCISGIDFPISTH